jgi:putative lipase involved disintegration of autophagic bodies
VTQDACSQCSTVVATGHSLGAALAALFILDIGVLLLFK